MKQFLKLSLLLLALLLPATAMAYDFQVGNIQYTIQYTITSDSTVEVSGIQPDYNEVYLRDIEIPSHVSFNNVNYTVTAIGDNAINCEGIDDYNEGGLILSDYNITIPETVKHIGYHAFCGYGFPHNIVCLAKTPPVMNDIIDRHDDLYCPWPINLFVPAESYALYQEINNYYHYFDSIYITNGERSRTPIYNVKYLRQISNSPYGCFVKIYPYENSVIYSRTIMNDAIQSHSYLYYDDWSINSVRDSLFFYYETDPYDSYYREGWMVEFYAIEDGKSPSFTMSGGDLYDEDGWGYFVPKWYEIFDFLDSGISYNILDNQVEVTFRGYSNPYGQKVNSDNRDLINRKNINQPSPGFKLNYSDFEDADRINYYSGDVVIPCFANYHDYDNDTYSSFLVTSLGKNAFKDCAKLKSVVLPTSITRISNETFVDCPQLTFIKCLGTIPPSANNESFDNGVYQYTTLYVPYDATEAYRRAKGWSNFQNIVGFYGQVFNYDGIHYKKISNNKVVVTYGEEAYSGGIVIPESVTVNGITYLVTGIDNKAFANSTLDFLSIPVAISDSITSNAFEGSNITSIHITGEGPWKDGALPASVETLYIGSGVTSVEGLQVNPTTIYSYASVPPTCDGNTFTGYDATLHVPASSLAAYFTAPYWCNFINIIGDAVEPTELTIDNDSINVLVGEQIQLNVTLVPNNATPCVITWTSSNDSIATVSDGRITFVGPGECDVKAILLDKVARCHVVVARSNIQLDQHELLLLPNHIELLTPTVTPVSTDLAVTSTNPSVAAARLANGKIQVVGIAEGTTTIRVNSTDGYAEPDSCVVKVYTLRGDVNGDGFVNISDATLLISYLVAPSETIHQVNADTNNDGQINISDATRLISYLLTGEELEPKPDNEFETETITVNGVSFDMVSVEGGTFMMGATPEQGDEALDKEKPVHRVTVSSFAMSQTEVTQELWQAVMGSNPSHFTGDPKRPVELVSWNDCQTFIAQLNQLTGKRFRLPTEAEWEYAARGGNRYKVTRYAGSNNIDEVAWYDADSGNTTHPVATKAPNELGLYDMTGNVWEWCQDWYALYSADDQTDPTGPETGNNRVLRGGCWNGGTNYDRISFRDNFRPSGSNSSGGLRLVLDQEVVYTVNGVSFTMVPVKGGTFTMGATEEEDADHATFVASPKHQVTLSNFSIGQTEVTQELWVAVMGSNPSQDTSNLQYPVSYINWPDCDSFITKLNELTGLHFRLPTEAEWEYAAKGGANSQGFVYSGSDDLDEVAWISTNSDSHPHQVATKKANELGLYDMNGNIEEWCHDWYSLYTEDPVVNPSGPETGMSKVHRGGRWNGSAKYCRLTRRDGFSQGVKRNYMGMRLAL